MNSEIILDCVQSFSNLLSIRYGLVLGKAGKQHAFDLTFRKDDLHHLMGLHYLLDRPDRRSRTRIFEDLISSESYREHIASSDFWSTELESRVACTFLLESIIDDNHTIFRYNHKILRFYSRIRAEYLMSNSGISIASDPNAEIYLFLDKRNDCEERFCKSVFPKGELDYTDRQSVWTLLYKVKYHEDGSAVVLYRHNSYKPSLK